MDEKAIYQPPTLVALGEFSDDTLGVVGSYLDGAQGEVRQS